MASATRPVRLLLGGLWCVLLLSAGLAPAYADSPSSGGDVTVAQSLGDRELTVVLRRVTSVPGPLQIDVITHAGTAPGTLTLAVTPIGITTGSAREPAPGLPTAHSSVELGKTPGAYSTSVQVDRPGPWEVSLGDGRRVARIPFVVPAQVTSPPERAIYGGFLGAGMMLLVTVIVATRARRSVWALVPVAGLTASLAVAVTGAVLSGSLPLPPQPGSQVDPTVDNVGNPYAVSRPLVSDFSRPPVILTLGSSPLRARQPGDLRLDLTDGATGAPVDDLIVHDSALIHLLLIGPGGQLWHLHPIRISPGRYEQHLTLPLAGHYAVSAELVRRGGGVQLVRAGLDVSPGRATTPATAAPLVLDKGHLTAMTMLRATHVMVTTTVPVAGRPTTVTVRAGDTAQLQPWLGMLGHLIVAGPLPTDADLGTAVQLAPVWSHVHSMGSMPGAGPSMPGMNMPGMDMPGMSGGSDSGGGMVGMTPVNGDSAPDETVAAYGPDVPFTYTFPTPGRYRLWSQVELRYAVLTVPLVIDVAAPSGQGMHG